VRRSLLRLDAGRTTADDIRLAGRLVLALVRPRRRPAQMQVHKAEAPGITKDCCLDCGRVNAFRSSELDKAKD
jgi:hypothetical protein